ncbi:MAG: hypothetical protein AAF573_08665 [Bacteroidota bacterium]
MRKKKNFTKAVGSYFFDIKMGFNNTITISRKNRKDAEYAFSNYLKQKKECEWLGKWDGKKFVDTDFNKAA